MQLRSRSGGATTQGRADAANLEHFASPSMNPADYFYPPASTQAQREALLEEAKQLHNAQEAKNWSYGLEVSNVPKHVPSDIPATADTLDIDIEAECQKIVLGNEAKPGHSSDKSSETEEFRLKTRSTAAYNNNHNSHVTFPFQHQHHHAASTAAEDDIDDDEELLITGGDNFILSSIHQQYKEAIGVDIILHNNNNNNNNHHHPQQAGDTDSASFGQHHHHHNQQPDTKATSQKRTHQGTVGTDSTITTTNNKAISSTTNHLMNDLLLPGGWGLTAITTNSRGTLMLNMDYEKALETINYQLAADRGVPNQDDDDDGGLVMAPFDGKRRRN